MSLSLRRAWIEIPGVLGWSPVGLTSLSLRRAWIEMDVIANTGLFTSVALLAESVDRNDTVQVVIVIMHASLSLRRAWIEMNSWR